MLASPSLYCYFQERCKGCQDLEQALALFHKMGGAASEYLSILEDIAADIQGLNAEIHGVFNTVPEKLLPQGLKNKTQDPREMIKQLGDLCRTGFTSIVRVYATILFLSVYAVNLCMCESLFIPIIVCVYCINLLLYSVLHQIIQSDLKLLKHEHISLVYFYFQIS